MLTVIQITENVLEEFVTQTTTDPILQTEAAACPCVNGLKALYK